MKKRCLIPALLGIWLVGGFIVLVSWHPETSLTEAVDHHANSSLHTESASTSDDSLPPLPESLAANKRDPEVFEGRKAGPNQLIHVASSPTSFTAQLAEGESVMTESKEMKPGVFSLTRLTPHAVPGNESVRIRAERRTVDLDGEVQILQSPEMQLTYGTTGIISVFTDEGLYRIHLHAEKTPDGVALSGSVQDPE